MDRDKRLYIKLYVNDFLTIMAIGYIFEIFALFLMEFAPFYYFDKHMVLLFIALSPVVAAVAVLAWEIYAFEHVGERLKSIDVSGVKRR